MNISELITKVIPISDYEHRNGFSNTPIIDSLDAETKRELEQELIKLLDKDIDPLVAETLAYMKSNAAVPALMDTISRINEPAAKLIFANSVYKIDGNQEAMEIGINAFKSVSDKYGKMSLFCYLATFKSPDVDEILDQYSASKDILLSANAKKAKANPK